MGNQKSQQIHLARRHMGANVELWNGMVGQYGNPVVKRTQRRFPVVFLTAK